MVRLSPQLDIVRNMVEGKEIKSIESLLNEILPLQQGFLELIKLLRMALTITVTSATAERSFSNLKRIKTYLRATMGQERLTHLAVLSTEKELTKGLDLDQVIDEFNDSQPRRIQLK